MNQPTDSVEVIVSDIVSPWEEIGMTETEYDQANQELARFLAE